jgi:glycerol-3-phosphate dehydrogenase
MFSRAAVSKAACIPRTSRLFTTTACREVDFTHAIIGGGVVGLAIARQLQARDGVSSILIEKHGSVGMETSSRNSEVSRVQLDRL